MKQMQEKENRKLWEYKNIIIYLCTNLQIKEK